MGRVNKRAEAYIFSILLQYRENALHGVGIGETMKKENNFLVVGAAVCFVIACIFSGLYKFSNEHVKQYSLDDNVIQSGELYFYGCDEPSIENNRVLAITGWIAPKEFDLTYIDRKVLIENQGVFYELNTIAVERGLTAFFNTGYDYTNGGIEAKCLTADLQGKEYKLYYLVKEQDGRAYLINLDKSIDISEG